MDNGNMQVGLLLTLQEDPPQTLFSARSVATMTHPRPFAPTARQRWATTALQYFKEMDVITTRRNELAAPKSSGDAGGGNHAAASAAPAAKRKPKAKGGGKGKQNAQSNQAAEEEA
jgi:hypothetical protein